MLRLLFDPVIAYRNINESYRLRTWRNLSSRSIKGGLFIIEGSKWAAWLREESSGILDDANLIHYAVLTPEDCIDIISEFPPHAEWLNG